MVNFVYAGPGSRVLFGSGTRAQVRAEVERVGGTRVLIVATASALDAARVVREQLADRAVAQFQDAAQHTPVEVTERALRVLVDNAVDCVVAIGGGSAIGLSKALALRTDVPQVVLPTTYAGSEVTAVVGQLADGMKTTTSDPRIRPETVIYDVDLTLSLPVDVSVASGVNAMAHAVEALYAVDANPVIDAFAVRALEKLATGLPRIAVDPSDPAARSDVLEAAWLAGLCLDGTTMGLQHKLSHTLGGSFHLPHAAAHAVLLPHTLAYNAVAVPEVAEKIARALGAPSAASGVYDLLVKLRAPISLTEIGFRSSDIAHAVELATLDAYPNPRPLTTSGLTELLSHAVSGTRPAAPPQLDWLTAEVAESLARTPNPRLRQLLTSLVSHLHAFAIDTDLTQGEWQQGIDFLTETGQICSDARQEFILLSDTLGLSSVVDLMTNSRTPDTTPSAVLGPFYTPGPPAAEHGTDISNGLPGIPMHVDVDILDTQGNPVAGAHVDVWQSNEDGFYDLQLPDLDGPVLRARFTSDDKGKVRFWSILPVPYPIPFDGPVGRMLLATNRHPYRAPHEHFLIQATGHRQLITQLFVSGGDYLDSDSVFGVKEPLIVDFTEQTGPTPDGRTVNGPWRSLNYTFHIAKETIA